MSSDPAVATPSVAQRFQPGIQSALALVQHAEQRAGGLPDLLVAAVGRRWSGPSRQQHPAGPQLPLAPLRRRGAVQEPAVEFLAGQAAGADQLAQRIPDFDLDDPTQLIGEPSRGRLLDQASSRGEQGPRAGETDPLVEPQTVLVVGGQFVQSVEAAAVGIAGPAARRRQFAAHGASAGGAERLQDLVQLRDGFLAQQGDDRLGSEGFGSHAHLLNVESGSDARTLAKGSSCFGVVPTAFAICRCLTDPRA